jgi:hypothetical protein
MIVFHRLQNFISTALALNKSNKVVESVEYNNNPPPYNPTHPDMHGSTETANNSDADSPSNQLLPPAPENVGTELGEYFIFCILESSTLKANSIFLNCA